MERASPHRSRLALALGLEGIGVSFRGLGRVEVDRAAGVREVAAARGAGAASILVVGKGAPAEAAVAEKMIAKGVTQRDLGEGPAMIPGYKRVALRDFVVQPGASSPPNAVMKNAMVCHISKGELRVVQDGKEFTAPRNHVWTCAVGTVEHVSNKGKSEAIMRITDLLPS